MSQETDFREKAWLNLSVLARNPYPGRGLVVGLSEDRKHLIQVYWIMGRSENSRNRIFVAEGGGFDLRTALANPNKKGDSSLTIYRAMAQIPNFYVVSNGDQTDTVISGDGKGMLFEQGMRCRSHEPDDPNFTPRITAIFSKRLSSPLAEILVLKKSEFGTGCNRFLYRYDAFAPGTGYCVTTYSGDGKPLPSFCGEPYPLPLEGDIDNVAASIWKSLNEENRVSLAVKFINAGEGDRASIAIINKYSAVA
jgi:IMP cyclohydrolase